MTPNAPPAPPSASLASPARWLALAAATLLLGALLFHPVGHFGFLNLDDQEFISQNPWLKRGLDVQSLSWAWHANLDVHSSSAEYWSPLTLLSRLAEAHLFGLNAGAFHIISAGLHLLNSLLLAAACYALTRHWSRSAVVALVFLVHPQNLEAACWLAARKDLLSATFFFVTLLAYAGYVRRPSLPRYALLLVAFACALMSKPMGVSVPLVLLVLDAWPLARWRTGSETWRENVRLVAEKLPLFIMAGLAAALAVVSQRDWNAIGAAAQFPLSIRVGNAVLSYALYLRRAIWPSDLAIFYPHPGYALSWPAVAVAAVILVAISLLVWLWRKREPWLISGWLWFGLVLGPVIGLVQIGGQAMADRYFYPAGIGLFLAITWAIGERVAARVGTVLGALLIGVCTVVSSIQVRTWESSVTVFQHALNVTHGNALAHLNLAEALMEQPAQLPLAREHLQQALALIPDSALAWNNLARTEALLGQDAAAAKAYEQTLRLDPNHRQALLFFARLLAKHQRYSAAQAHLEHLRDLDPALPQVWRELADLYEKQGDLEKARAARQHSPAP